MVTALTLVREVDAEVVKDNQVLLRDGGVHPRLTCVALALAREAETALLLWQLNLMVTALTLVREVEAEVINHNQVRLHMACHQDNEDNLPAFLEKMVPTS